MSTKYPCVTSASGEKKRKTVTNAPQLTMGLHPDNASILNVFKAE